MTQPICGPGTADSSGSECGTSSLSPVIPGQIAYLVLDPGGAGFDLAVVDSNGTHQTVIDKFDDFTPIWTPDGSHVVEGHVSCDLDFENCAMTTFTLGSGPGQRLPAEFPGRLLAWSRDGATLAYTLNDDDLWAARGDGTDPRQLIPAGTAAAGGGASFAPDGLTLAFACQVDPGNRDICTVRTDGTGFQRLTVDTAADVSPAWSPDGTVLAFATTRYGGTEIATIRPDGSGMRRLSAGTPADGPSWSPDGSQIAFDWHGVFVMRADGSTVRRLTSAGSSPAWRP